MYFILDWEDRLEKDNAFTSSDNIKNNISVKRTDEADDIAGAIPGIADKISGRFSVSESDTKIIDDKTITVSSKLHFVVII